MNHGRYEQLVRAAKEFVNKVETGRARSVNSYAAFKESLAAIEALQPEQAEGEDDSV